MFRHLLLVVVIAACGTSAAWLGPVAASAQDLAEAQRLFQRGVALADADRWGEAAEYFRQARSIAERPSIVCNLGVALHHLGQAAEATEALLRCQELAEEDAAWGSANAALVARTARLLEELRPATGTLELALAPPEASVALDGEPVAGAGADRVLELDPGRHILSVTAEGFEPHREEISMLSGDTVRRSVALVALPERPAVLVVESVAGAIITVDEVVAGTGRIETEIAPGAHRVRIEASGHEAIERRVELAAGERSTIDATFGGGRSIVEEPALWIGIAVGVVAVGVGITLGVVLSQPTDPLANYGGTTDVTLVPLLGW